MVLEYLLKKSAEVLFKKVLSTAFDSAKKRLKSSGSKLEVTKDDIEASLHHHLQFVENWSSEVSFNDLERPRLTTDIFVQLDLSVLPRRLRVTPEEQIKNIPLRRIFDYDPHHIILLGQPGAGKTTSMKFICQSILHDEQYYPNRFSFPLLIRLRELNGRVSSLDSTAIMDRIFDIFGLRIAFPDSLSENTESAITARRAIKEKELVKLLDEFNLLLILDGFDELIDLTDRNQALQDIKMLALALNRSLLVVTSRTGDFIYNIKNAVQYEMAPLTRGQITTFAQKWLKNRNRTRDFLDSVGRSPFQDASIRPLTLAHLCAIYQRNGAIPEKPKSVYQRIIQLFLEEWDQQRAITRKSKYGEFDVFRKSEFLAALAYTLTVSLHKSVFTRSDLRTVYDSIYKDFGLPSNQENQVVSEIETHTGLFLQSGYETYEFAHKSLQEYLAAQYLVKLPTLPPMKTLYEIPNELAIAVACSSKPSAYLCELVFHRMVGKGMPGGYIDSFVDRLELEKPDFDSNTNLGLAIIVLASLGGRHSRLETLFKSLMNKTSLTIIRTHYEKVSSTNYDHRLKRRLVKGSEALPNLPEFLNINNDLYKLMLGREDQSSV